MTTVVCDWRNVFKNFLQALLQEPIVGIFLNFNEIRHLKNFLLTGIAHTDVST